MPSHYRYAGALCLLYLAGLCVLLLVSQWTLPRFETAFYESQEGILQETSLPLALPFQQKPFTVTVALQLPRLYPSSYRLVPDDCLEEMTVNGIPVEDPAIPFCDTAGRVLDLSPYLQPGENLLQATVKDKGGKAAFRMEVARMGAVSYVFLAWTVLCGLALLLFPFSRRTKYLISLSVGGAALRFFYLLATPYFTRMYDVSGHMEYIFYVLAHLRVPPAQGGWEFYQPPLYYALAGAWTWVGRLLWRELVALTDLQVLSYFLSVALLPVIVLVTLRLFRQKETVQSCAFALFLIVFPGIVLFVPRINNDVLMLLLSFVFFWVLLRFWQECRLRDWLLGAVVLGLCLLTKSNTLPFAGIAGILLLAHPSLSWKRKMQWAAAGLAIAGAIAGWVFVLRFWIEKETFIVGNRLNSALSVTNTLPHLFAFNPIRLFQYPFSNPWGTDEEKQFFLEYFFRSALTGEWNFGDTVRPLAARLLAVSMLLLPVTAYGIVRETSRRFRQTLPLLLTLCLLAVASFCYRFTSPFGPNQDFRFVPLIIVPVAYYLIRGIEALPRPLRLAAGGLFLLFAILSVALLLMLPAES